MSQVHEMYVSSTVGSGDRFGGQGRRVSGTVAVCLCILQSMRTLSVYMSSDGLKKAPQKYAIGSDR